MRKHNPWTRLGETGKMRGTHVHRDGFKIEHCGHMTANWPYTLEVPGEDTLVVGANGKCWPTIGAAKAAVALLEDGEAWLVKPESGGATRIYTDDQVREAQAAGIQLRGRRWRRVVSTYEIAGESFAVVVG